MLTYKLVSAPRGLKRPLGSDVSSLAAKYLFLSKTHTLHIYIYVDQLIGRGLCIHLSALAVDRDKHLHKTQHRVPSAIITKIPARSKNRKRPLALFSDGCSPSPCAWRGGKEENKAQNVYLFFATTTIVFSPNVCMCIVMYAGHYSQIGQLPYKVEQARRQRLHQAKRQITVREQASKRSIKRISTGCCYCC